MKHTLLTDEMNMNMLFHHSEVCVFVGPTQLHSTFTQLSLNFTQLLSAALITRGGPTPNCDVDHWRRGHELRAGPELRCHHAGKRRAGHELDAHDVRVPGAAGVVQGERPGVDTSLLEISRPIWFRHWTRFRSWSRLSLLLPGTCMSPLLLRPRPRILLTIKNGEEVVSQPHRRSRSRKVGCGGVT